MNEELIIENASLREFILGFVKNLGRTEVTALSLISKKIYGIWRTLTNFNLPGKSKKNVEHHYDVGGPKPRSTFKDGYLALKIANAAYQSLKQKKVVKLK